MIALRGVIPAPGSPEYYEMRKALENPYNINLLEALKQACAIAGIQFQYGNPRFIETDGNEGAPSDQYPDLAAFLGLQTPSETSEAFSTLPTEEYEPGHTEDFDPDQYLDVLIDEAERRGEI